MHYSQCLPASPRQLPAWQTPSFHIQRTVSCFPFLFVILSLILELEHKILVHGGAEKTSTETFSLVLSRDQAFLTVLVYRTFSLC